MITIRLNQLVLGACTIFIACGAPTNERGIASSTSDSTASGSAYNTYDGFAPAAKKAPGMVAAPPAPMTNSPADSATVNPTVVPPVAAVAGTTPPPPAAAPKPAVADDSADITKGQGLISKSDCLVCHKVDAKLVGPSYKDVAAKYPNTASTINQLADKIQKGGSGAWGPVPMMAHPTLSDGDAKAMVKYILSLK